MIREGFTGGKDRGGSTGDPEMVECIGGRMTMRDECMAER